MPIRSRPSISTSAVLFCVILCSSTTGCSMKAQNLNASKMGPPYEITVFDHGKPVAKRKLKAMSADEQAIAHWIEANRRGWRPTFSNQAPNRVVKGEGFTLNFNDKECVITIPPDPESKAAKEGKEPMRLYKKVSPGDIELAEALNGGPERE